MPTYRRMHSWVIGWRPAVKSNTHLDSEGQGFRWSNPIYRHNGNQIRHGSANSNIIELLTINFTSSMTLLAVTPTPSEDMINKTIWVWICICSLFRTIIRQYAVLFITWRKNTNLMKAEFISVVVEWWKLRQMPGSISSSILNLDGNRMCLLSPLN